MYFKKKGLDNLQYKHLGSEIRKARKSRGLTGPQLAQFVNSSKSTISKIEKGYIADLVLARNICNIFDLDYEALIEEDYKVELGIQLLTVLDNNEENKLLREQLQLFIKRAIIGIVFILAIATSVLTYATTGMTWKIINDISGRVTILFGENVKWSPPDDPSTRPDYWQVPIYQPIDPYIRYDYSVQKIKTRYATEKGQEYWVEMQKAKQSAEKYAKSYLKKYKVIDIEIKDKTIALYYSDQKALFLLEELLYVFEYDFHTEQVINIIVSMEKEMLR